MSLESVISGRGGAPNIHVQVVAMAERRMVLRWNFEGGNARPDAVRHNAAVAVSDGKSVTSFLVLQQQRDRFKEGVSYVLRGYTLRGQAAPFQLNIRKETHIFRSAPLPVPEELVQEGREAINPPSRATPLEGCVEQGGLLSVQGEVVRVRYKSPARSINVFFIIHFYVGVVTDNFSISGVSDCAHQEGPERDPPLESHPGGGE